MYNFRNLLSMTSAADYTGIMISKSDRTVRQWLSDFRENGCIPDTKQGRYERTGILWSSEHRNKKAYQHVQENVNVKGRPNMTSHSFCRWVNEELLSLAGTRKPEPSSEDRRSICQETSARDTATVQV